MKRLGKSAATAPRTTDPKSPQLDGVAEIDNRERASTNKNKKEDATVAPSSKHDDVDPEKGMVDSSKGQTGTLVVSVVPSDSDKGSFAPPEREEQGINNSGSSISKGFLVRLTSADRGIPAAYMEDVDDDDADDNDDLDVEDQQTSSVVLGDSSKAILGHDSSDK